MNVPAPGAVLRFVLAAALVFVALMALGPREAYPRWFRGAGNALYHSLGSDRAVRFTPFDDPRGVHDTRMSIGHRIGGLPKGIGLNSLRQGYTPAAVLVALVLATPLAWRRKAIALALGLLLVHVFVALRVLATLLWGFSILHVNGEPMLALSPLAAWLVRRADQVLAGDLHVTYLVPAVLWLLLTVGLGHPVRSPDEADTAVCPS